MLSLFFIAGFTTIYLDGKNNPFSDNIQSLERNHRCAVNEEGESKIIKEPISNFEPGTYNISVETVGRNLTFMFKSAVEKKKFTTNKSFSFRIEIRSTLWYSFIIEDPPMIDYENFNQSLENSKLFITFDKLDGDKKDSTYYIWGVALTGGVLFAANEARIYRRKRE